MPRLRLVTLSLWLLALLLALWTLAQLPLETIARSIASLDWPQWLAWSVLNILIIGVLTLRWHLLSEMLGMKVGFGKLLLIRQGGQAVSFITPGPQFGGEPLQLYWLWKQCRMPLRKAVLALGLDRFCELWVNFSVLLASVLLLLLFPAMNVPGWRRMLAVLLALLCVLSLLGWTIARRPQWLSARMESLARRWQHHPRLKNIESHWTALGRDLREAVETRKPALLQAFALSVLGWAGLLMDLELMLYFLDVEHDLSAFLLILVAMRLAMLLPSPGGIGTIEASLLWAFQALNLPVSAAAGLIALMRLRDAVVLVIGLVCLRILQVNGKNAESV